MMSKFNKYIITMFIKYTIAAQLFITIITLVANTFQHTKMLNQYNITIVTLVIYDLLKTPYLLYSTMPMSIVVSTMMVMITLLKHNELTAYVALGGKIRNLSIPFIVAGILLSGYLYISADYINPKVIYIREKFDYDHIRHLKLNTKGKLRNMWLKESDSSFININLMDQVSKRIFGIKEYHLDQDFQVERLITYKSASFENDKWVMTEKKVYDMIPVPKLTETSELETIERPLFDELSELSKLRPKFLSLDELRKTTNLLKSQDLSAAKYELQIYQTYAHVLSVLVIILVTFPLCIGFNRNHSYIKVASKALFVGFGYWIIAAALQSLGKTGVIAPATASFIPIGIYAVLAVILIVRRERAL